MGLRKRCLGVYHELQGELSDPGGGRHSRISIRFQVNNEPNACAVTGVEGDVTDLILPAVGDIVSHCDQEGMPMIDMVTHRLFTYAMPNGVGIGGDVMIMLSIERSSVQ